MEFKCMCTIVPAITLAVIFITMLESATACTCNSEHPQVGFCRADFVFKASVKSSKIIYTKSLAEENGTQVEQRIPYQVKYVLHVNKIHKETEAFTEIMKNGNRRRIVVYTPVLQSACGVILKNDTKYLVSGIVIGDRATINLCNLIMEWKNMTLRQRKGISHQYEQNCRCHILPCFGKRCIKIHHDVCAMDILSPAKKCYMDHSYCYFKKGNCKWSKTKVLQTCKNKLNDQWIP